ncbi:thiamine pyrophosphate-dependent dehydrogenase E1 component subunit alpha [Bradyrhizobium yuanmingense]|uniref:thiamine pyrophosphate-dependent dehydrogenase E1 component subunit alpha n=1 Tax=Bradyrhizobium yuanmingense TaxID=108015 RepID=UPI0023B8BAE4|nr:thiamine pyrophosphate-dependent dehydrogenase E1 component subunit alpha [Bradyrhizobium yuanmingense]MDF0498893.1 thiamine pyrophosphate-dependent dehydrogenase E1 component subunit alpha [Bradyrhizobium yuanmingense]
MSDKRKPNIDVGRLRAHYLMMHRIRALEEVALRALNDKLLPGGIHPSIGQEAVAVGVIAHLTQQDLILSTHRGHGHTLAKGASSVAMFHELLGREGGACGGKGGSMHIADFRGGMLGANGVVAANIVIAAGAAHAVKLKKEDRMVVCFFGDGASNRGPFLEGLNWAAVFKLPVLFVCEDNGYAATTRTCAMTAGLGFSARARALGVPAVEVDGNDVLAVEAAAAECVRHVRAAEGPRLLHAKTFRVTGHTSGDPGSYRPEGEVEAAKARDPILRAGQLLTSVGVAADALNADRNCAYTEMEAAYRSARDAPFPAASSALVDVQDVGSPLVEPF